jgi:hypothetical protein
VDEHVVAPVIANDEPEALLRIEEFDDAFAFADDLRGHSASTAATKAASAASAAVAAATAEAAAVAVATASAASEASTITIAATAAEASALLVTATEFTCEIVFAKTVALVATATTAVSLAPSIETHIRPNLLARLPLKPTRSGRMAQPVMARNPLTHHSRHYSKNGARSSDSNCTEILRGWQDGREGD